MKKRPPIVAHIHRSLTSFTRMGALLASLSLCLLFILALLDIILRLITNQGLDITLEFSGYLVAASLFLGVGWTLLEDGHIQVKLLHKKIPPPLLKALNLILFTAGLIISSLLAYGLTVWTLGTYNTQQLSYFTSQTPLYVPQLLLTLGPYMLCSAFLVKIIESFWADGGQSK